jgi:hypothetical protein
MSHFTYTIGFPVELGGELYQFDPERSKLGGPEQPVAQLILTRPLAKYNPIITAQPGTRFTKFIIREYDRFNNLMKMIEYRDIKVLKLEQGPDLILEFGYKP